MSAERGFISRAKRGDTRAFEYLMTQHAQYVYNLVYRLVGSREEAEDLSQEVFLKAWRNIKSFRGDAQFKTWLYRIATNLCYNRMPNLKRELDAIDASDDLSMISGGTAVESEVILLEAGRTLHAALQTMPANYRLLLILRHLQDFSYNEISEITNMPLGTVKTGIFRARAMLKERLTSPISNNND